MTESKQRSTSDKCALVWGLGVSGRALVHLLDRLGYSTIIAVDQKPLHQIVDDPNQLSSHVKYYPQDQMTLEQIVQLQPQPELILYSPGIDRRTPFWQALQQRYQCLGEFDFCAPYLEKPVVAVTGTNGKSTTVNMIAQGLGSLGLRPFLGGNWGIPLASVVATEQAKDVDFYILETSSFQCEELKILKPLVGVLLNLSDSHRERYEQLEDYLSAKWQLLKQVGRFGRALVPGSTHRTSLMDQMLKQQPPAAALQEFSLLSFQRDFPVFRPQIRGEHNLLNFAATWEVLKILVGETKAALALRWLEVNFNGIEHRLERFHHWNSWTFFNDSKSTNMISTVRALKSFLPLPAQHRLILVMGGKLRDPDWKDLGELPESLSLTQSPCELWTFGEAGPRLAELVHSQASNVLGKVKNFKDLTALVQALYSERLQHPSAPTTTVVLSPGFPSFDQYRNFEHRGQHFKELIKHHFSEDQHALQ